MTNENNLYKGISRIAWGYFFLYVNFNINSVNLLPQFVGYLLFLSAIGLLREDERDLSLLRIPCILLAAWNAFGRVTDMFGVQTDGVLRIVGLIATLLDLYFHFQLLTDLARIAEKYQSEGDTHDRKLLQCRTAQTVMLTVIFVITQFQPWVGDAWTYISVLILLAYLGVCFYMMYTLFSLRKSLRVPQTENEDEDFTGSCDCE